MRGRRDSQLTMLAFIDLEEGVSKGHPLRTIKRLADGAPSVLSHRCSTRCTQSAGAVDPARAVAEGVGPVCAVRAGRPARTR